MRSNFQKQGTEGGHYFRVPASVRDIVSEFFQKQDSWEEVVDVLRRLERALDEGEPGEPSCAP